MLNKLKSATFRKVYSRSRETRSSPADPGTAAQICCATMKLGQSKRQPMRAKSTEIAKVLGLANAESVTLLDLAHRCEEGLPKSCFQRLNDNLAPEGRQFLHSLIFPASLSRRKDGKLTQCESDCTVRLADCWLMALDTFRDESKVRRFLARPHPLIDGRPPMAVSAGSTCGAEVIYQLLGRLKYGSAA